MSNDLLPPPGPAPAPSPRPAPSGSDPAGPRTPHGDDQDRAPERGAGRTVAVALLSALAAVTIAWGTVSAADLVARTETTETFTRDVAPRLRIETDGRVQVTAGPVDSVSIERTVERGLRAPEVSAAVTSAGDELVLSGDCPAVVSSWCSVDYAVVVPANTEVIVDSGSGSITVTGIDGDITASSSSGSVYVVDVSGQLRLSSSAGPVLGEQLASATVRADSSAGSVRLVFDVAPTSVDADSSAGSVELVVPDDSAVYAVDASTSAGSARIEVATDPSADRTLRLRSSAGDVSVRHPD